MNFRLLCCLATGVFVTYVGLVMLIVHLRPAPYTPLPPKPNFTERSTVVVDPQTGEKTTYREITVSTKFAPEPGTPPPALPRIDTTATR